MKAFSDTIKEEENMFSKKALRIGLMALIVVALMSYSIAAEDKIIIGGKLGRSAEVFISSLQTPPPGYVLEKSFGSFVVVGEYAAFSFVNSKDVDETITKTEKVFEEIVKKLSGNAVLAERISTQATGRDGNRMLVIQGEAALLKPAP